MTIWELIVALILGIVEGLTEFAPISSTGHMIIIDDLLLKSAELLNSQEIANTFKIVIQLGSILAAVIVFWSRLLRLIGIDRDKAERKGPHLKLSHVMIGLIPAILFGFMLEEWIDTYLFSVETVLIGLGGGALLMALADWKTKLTERKNHNYERTSLDKITHKQALLIGLFQCIALWPGFSRSGSTISGGVLLGMKYRSAADFTFIMAVPIMFGASALSLYKKMDLLTIDLVPFFTIGFVSAFIFSWLSIQFFLALISRIRLMPFALYRMGLAIFILIVYINMK